MEKVKEIVKVKYMAIDRGDKTAKVVFKIAGKEPITKIVKLDKKETFTSSKNRLLILAYLRKNGIIVTEVKPKKERGITLFYGDGAKLIEKKIYKSKWYKPKEQGYSFLEVTIVAAIIAGLGGIALPSLIALSQKIETTHVETVEDNNANIDLYNSLLNGE